MYSVLLSTSPSYSIEDSNVGHIFFFFVYTNNIFQKFRSI